MPPPRTKLMASWDHAATTGSDGSGIVQVQAVSYRPAFVISGISGGTPSRFLIVFLRTSIVVKSVGSYTERIAIGDLCQR